MSRNKYQLDRGVEKCQGSTEDMQVSCQYRQHGDKISHGVGIYIFAQIHPTICPSPFIKIRTALILLSISMRVV